VIAGYARVSRTEQNPDLQERALREAGCERIWVERASGARSDRPELAGLLEQLRAGDVLVVWRLDRLGRSVTHLLHVVDDLGKRGVEFRSLCEGMDTTTANGRLLFTVFAAVAEFERGLLIERTQAGLEAARARGHTGGRPPKLSNRQHASVLEMYEAGQHTVSQIAKLTGVARSTIYRAIALGPR
jgi:DNA invertase Pin-like site-specific DNA recombinase